MLNLDNLIKNYPGKWVAFGNENYKKVIVSGNSAKKVATLAKQKGYEVPTLFKVPTKLVAYIG